MPNFYRPKNYLHKASKKVLPVNVNIYSKKHNKLINVPIGTHYDLYKKYKCVFTNNEKIDNRLISLVVEIIKSLTSY